MSKEKYLYLKMEGHEGIALFKNKDKEKTGKENLPDYKSKGGCAIWVREYDTEKNKNEEEVVTEL